MHYKCPFNLQYQNFRLSVPNTMGCSFSRAINFVKNAYELVDINFMK